MVQMTYKQLVSKVTALRTRRIDALAKLNDLKAELEIEGNKHRFLVEDIIRTLK